ncbi:MAG TPA: molybdopterin molybdotransferase MoeA [Nitrospiria bacterium]
MSQQNPGNPPDSPNAQDPVQKALDQFIPNFPIGPIGAEKIPIEKALGRVTARDIKTLVDSPPYSRSIIEGFVVNTLDIQSASPENPLFLSLLGEITLGMSKITPITAGGAYQVSTGSLIPSGDVSVIRLFEVERSGKQILIKKALQSGENIETKGCDLKKGSILIPKGKKMTPDDIGILASQGILKVQVAKAPKVAIFSSGNEVIPPTKPLKPGLIWDCNSYSLAVSVLKEGGIPIFKGIMKDDFNGFLKRLNNTLAQAHMVLISGGTAVGGRDFIKDLINAAGKPGTLVDGVPMRSGKPLIMGVIGKKPIVCVAGHPPEALRGFSLFGAPALERLLGKTAP